MLNIWTVSVKFMYLFQFSNMSAVLNESSWPVNGARLGRGVLNG